MPNVCTAILPFNNIRYVAISSNYISNVNKCVPIPRVHIVTVIIGFVLDSSEISEIELEVDICLGTKTKIDLAHGIWLIKSQNRNLEFSTKFKDSDRKQINTQ